LAGSLPNPKFLTIALDTQTAAEADGFFPSYGELNLLELSPPCENLYFRPLAIDLTTHGSNYALWAVERVGANLEAASVEVTASLYLDGFGLRTITQTVEFAAGETVKVIPTLVYSEDLSGNLEIELSVRNLVCVGGIPEFNYAETSMIISGPQYVSYSAQQKCPRFAQ
jgi:hypothetical protein